VVVLFAFGQFVTTLLGGLTALRVRDYRRATSWGSRVCRCASLPPAAVPVAGSGERRRSQEQRRGRDGRGQEHGDVEAVLTDAAHGGVAEDPAEKDERGEQPCAPKIGQVH
jgi:hypothetical protein